ncbi:MAG TPA: cytosine deaminase [Halomonas sp.]|nr:cytosine deaminase [Halomonas sp.]
MQIVNARLRQRPELYRIEISNGLFTDITAQDSPQTATAEQLDAGGKLICAPFIEPHIHLDAALTAGEPSWNQSGTLFEGIERWGERKPLLNEADIRERVLKTLNLLIGNGVQFVRTHADTSDPSLVGLKTLCALRDELKDKIDIQVVAFPQDGLLSYPGGDKLMEEALEIGADVVGGIPHFEYTRELGVASMKRVIELAMKYDRLVDVHCDEIDDPQSRFLEVLAAEALSRDYGSRVTASHTCAMHSYDDAYCSRLFRLLGKSGLNFVALPTENLHLQGRFDGYPKRRGVTRVPELLDAGLKVCFGQDSIRDPWYPMGNGNLLRTLDVGLHACHMLGMERIDTALEIVTDNGAAALNLKAYEIAVGNPARCMLVNGATPYEVLLNQSPVLASIRDGRCLVQREAPVHEVAGWS